MKDNGIMDEEMIKFVTQEEMKKKTTEDEDLENRKRNIIMYRIPEKKTERVSDQRESDLVFLKDLMDAVFDMKIEDQDITKMYRLGQWNENKPRPLLLAFRNMEQMESVTSNLSNFRSTRIDKFKGIGISHDLSPQERQKIKRKVELAKQEHTASTTDSSDGVENYHFPVVRKGQRQRVLKIKLNRLGA